jgi:4-amino-4-deoxy-L-arabinose transferase-like glycosyltransferase
MSNFIFKSLPRAQKRNEILIFLFLAIFVLILRWPSLEQPFENDSGATAYHARLIYQGEPLYGTHHPAHHMPGVYYSYALAFQLFGDSVWAVNFLLILWLILSTYILYLLASTIVDKPTGLLAGILFAFLSMDVSFMGSTAKIEQFANLPRIAVIFILVRLLIQKSAPRKYFFVGLFSAVVFLYKAVYFSPLTISAFVLVGDYIGNKNKPGQVRLFLLRALWIGLGFISAIIPVGIYFGLSGLLPRFFQVFTIGQKYIHIATNDSPVLLALTFPFFRLGYSNPTLMVFFLGGIYFLFRCRKTIRNWIYLIIILLWFVLSYIEASASLTGFVHYYIPLLPPIAIITAWFLIDVSRLIRNNLQTKHHHLSIILPGILILSAFSHLIYNNFDTYYYYFRQKMYQDSYEEFILAGFPYSNLQYPIDVARYIQGHTSADDFIVVWSDDIQIYYLADRRCPIDIIWPIYSEATGPYTRIFQSKTQYIILGDMFFEFFPDWLYEELDGKYQLETIIHGLRIYTRIEIE